MYNLEKYIIPALELNIFMSPELLQKKSALSLQNTIFQNVKFYLKTKFLIFLVLRVTRSIYASNYRSINPSISAIFFFFNYWDGQSGH